MELGPGWMDLHAQVKIASKNWSKIFEFQKKKVEFAEKDGKKNWGGRIGDGENIDVEVVQTVTQEATGLTFDFKTSALKDSDMEALVFWIDVPASLFAKGSYRTEGKDSSYGDLPAELPQNHILSSGKLETVRLFNPDKSILFLAQFGEATNVTIQDGRKWGPYFSVLIHMFQGTLLKGESTKFSVTLRAAGTPDQSVAEFALDASKPRYSVRGLGGNYCFSIDSPEKDATLAQLKPQFARTEISLQQWQPRRGAPPTPNAGKVPREFELMRQLAQKKIPFIASIWQAPDWMCQPIEVKEGNRTVKYTGIKPEVWPEMIESIGAYLLHAKTEFQAEADYFSFNETDCGAKIKMSPEEHRDLIKRAGAQFEKLGLKTKCLLGDVSNPRVPRSFIQPALDDPEAMKYAGAVAFHAWNTGTAAEYTAWGDLAERLKLPLIVAEAGVDSSAWVDGSYRSFDNAVREMTQYQELFAYARPQAILYWEYTADYSLMQPDPSAKSNAKTAETERFALQKHWLTFIPPGSEALTISGGKEHVMLSAFRKAGENGAFDYTLNLSNAVWPRKARITGIPPEIKALNAVQTTRGSLMQQLSPMAPVNGVIEIELPARSLTTLTTMK